MGTTMKKCGGFTLVEIIIVIVIVAVVSGIAARIILTATRAYSDETHRSNITYQTKLALERMAREIRVVRSRTAADMPVMAATDFRFTDILGAQVGFRLNGNTLERTEDNGASWQPLAVGITALTFAYLQQNNLPPATATTVWYIDVDLTAQEGSESMRVRTRVHPMNFQ